MAGGKVTLCIALLMLLGAGGVTSQASSTQAVAKETPVTEPASTVTAQPEEAVDIATERFNATRVLSALRTELARRRTERQQAQQQRVQERREQILRTLDSLSDRKREFELRRQEAPLQGAEAQQEARRQEMEARRVGRLPVRERDRYNRARLEQLAEETPVEENEIDDAAIGAPQEEDLIGGGDDVASEAVQRVRNLLLIEEANGNLRLIDLDTEEGRQVVLEGVQREAETATPAEAESERDEAARLKLKIGQI